jgi:hypothetical protein
MEQILSEKCDFCEYKNCAHCGYYLTYIKRKEKIKMELLKGKRTYIIAILTIIYAVTGWITGYLAPDLAIPIILGALGLSALRAAVK